MESIKVGDMVCALKQMGYASAVQQALNKARNILPGMTGRVVWDCGDRTWMKVAWDGDLRKDRWTRKDYVEKIDEG